MLAIGVFSHIALQVILNLLVVTGLFPTTGVTLPFFSYGGSASVFLLMEIGLVLSVNKYSIQSAWMKPGKLIYKNDKGRRSLRCIEIIQK